MASVLINPAGNTLHLGATIASGVDIAPVVGTKHTVTVSIHSRGIDTQHPVTVSEFINHISTVTQLYRTPAPLPLSAPGGHPVSAANAGTVLTYTHRLFRHAGAAATAPHYTHYLGGEYAAFAIRNQYNKAGAVFHTGAPAPIYSYTSKLPAADYIIPAGAAFGYYFTKGSSYLLSSRERGTLRVDFSGGSVVLNITLRSPTEWLVYIIEDWQMRISPDGRTFSNAHCRSAGGTVTANCGGTAAYKYWVVRTSGHRNSATISGGRAVKINGAFYGRGAQEAGIAVWHWIRSRTTVYVGMLGRRVDSGGYVPPDPPPARTNMLAAFPSAEHAAFITTFSGKVAHTGTRTHYYPLITSNHRAVYRIAAGKAGGVYTGADGTHITLKNIGSGDSLAVNFNRDEATLNLSVQDASGAHRYAVGDLELRLWYFGGFGMCGNCINTVNLNRLSGSGALSGFTVTTGLEVDGAFYGATPEEFAALLRHEAGSSGHVELGIVGKEVDSLQILQDFLKTLQVEYSIRRR